MEVSLAAGFRLKARFADDDIVRQALQHVVNRQRRNARTSERFHLNAGLVRYLAAAINDSIVATHRDGDFAAVEPERMTERDQFVRFLGRHHAGNNRGRKHGALFGLDLVTADLRSDFSGQAHDRDGMRRTL